MSDPIWFPISESRFSEILDAIGEAVFAVDAEERFFLANRKALDMWAKEANEIVGRRILEVFPEVEKTEAYRAYRKAIETLSAVHLETRAQALGGRWIGLDVYPTPEGGLVVAFRNIDERKKAEAALQESEERFRTILEALPHIAFFIRSGGTAEYYNKRFTEYVGGPIGVDPASRLALHHPDDRERLTIARAEGASRSSEYTVEARILRHDGVYRWHLIHNRPVRIAGKVVAWVGTAVDIDEMRRAKELLEQHVFERTAELQATNAMLTSEIEERKRTEMVLKKSEERHRKLYNRTPMALQSVDSEARLIDVNDHWLKLFGYRREEVLGCSPSEFMTDDSARQYRENAWPEMLGSQGQVRTVEYRFLKSSGEAFDGRLAACGEFDAEGRFLRSWSVIADITSEKKAETQLRQTQRMDAVGQLTSGVAHDFNNLLTAILGNLEMLEARLDHRHEWRELTGARDAAERGARLTAQLLAFARKQRMAPEPVDLNQVVIGMTALLKSTIGATAQIKTVLADTLWPALADAGQVELVLLNLAINARDAMSAGGMITIETANISLGAPVRPEEPQAGDYVMVAVADTGTGISPEIRDRVFEPFFTTKGVGKGSGLGLPQVLGVAKQLGGGVCVDTSPGEGTTVKLFLPRTGERVADGWRALDSVGLDSVRSQRSRDTVILLVDDDSDVRGVTAALLEDQGYEVIEAGNGRAALECLEREGNRIELIIVDFAMPGMNGVEVARLVRRKWPDIPILFITGFAAASTFAMDATAADILQKPFGGKELFEKVQKALNRNSMRGYGAPPRLINDDAS